MIRDPARLEDGRFDMLVIGGGIYGAWTAYDAALRGLRVAIIDKGDWASGTSSASTKLIHGGLRYLEQFRFGLVRKSLNERRLLASLAPHRVMPLRFVLPLYDGRSINRWFMRAGLSLYDRLGGNGQPVGPHAPITRRNLIGRYPFLSVDGLHGGFLYGDCQTDDARFTLEIISGATTAGALAVNYAEAIELTHDAGQVIGARIRDNSTRREFEVRASIVVNTAGAWSASINGRAASPRPIRLTKGVHIILPALPTNDGFLFRTRRDHRVLFVIPWYDRTLVGTTDTNYDGDPNDVHVKPEDIDYLLTESNRFIRVRNWDRAHVYGSFVGIRTLQDHAGKAPSRLTREWSLEVTESGMIVSTGGKFTSARADAARLVDHVCGDRTLASPPPGDPGTSTAVRPFPWAPRRGFAGWQRRAIREGINLGLDEETARWNTRRYGNNIDRMYTVLRADASLCERIVPGLPFSKAEIVYAARHEMVVTLEDLLRRRIPLLILDRTSVDTIEEVAALAALDLGWSAEQRNAQVRALLARTRENAPA